MTDKTILKALRRNGAGKSVARKMRQAGQTPAVLYGGDEEPVHLGLNTRDADYLFRSISVENTIVNLEVEGEKGSVQTLVREIQTHPWKETLLHVDFLRIQKGVAVDVEIPLQLVGTPEGVRLEGGSVEQIIYEIPIRCIPSKIPEVIEVDVSGLNVGDVIHVSDVEFDKDIEVTIAQERTICSVAAPKAEEEVVEEEAEEEEGAVDASPGAEADDPEG
ncbi:50S ribosomal protein L25 [Gemmatimonadales bacterium]|nr:50S ribosomal protein L25 [Gemmatimonadales bacterium]